MAKNKHKNIISNIIWSIITLLLVAAVVFGIIILFKQNNQPAQDDGSKDARDVNTATKLQTEEDLKDEEKVAEASNEAKDRQEADEKVREEIKSSTPQTSSGLNVAKPEITYIAEEDGAILIGADVKNIQKETGGSCIFTLSNGDKSASVTTNAEDASSYISCVAGRIEKSKLSAGDWSVVVKYKSKLSEGESEAQSYQVQ